jgi:hypothetical protein
VSDVAAALGWGLLMGVCLGVTAAVAVGAYLDREGEGGGDGRE